MRDADNSRHGHSWLSASLLLVTMFDSVSSRICSFCRKQQRRMHTSVCASILQRNAATFSVQRRRRQLAGRHAQHAISQRVSLCHQARDTENAAVVRTENVFDTNVYFSSDFWHVCVTV